MKCPSCNNSDLKPTRIDEGLSAMGCSQCGGAYISLLYYRDWVERHPAEETETVELEKKLPTEWDTFFIKLSKMRQDYDQISNFWQRR